MNIAIRPTLALLSVLTLVQALIAGWGFYSATAAGWAALALLLALAAALLPDWSVALRHTSLTLLQRGAQQQQSSSCEARNNRPQLLLSAATAVLLSGQAVFCTHLLYSERPLAEAVIWWSALAGWLLLLSLVVVPRLLYWPCILLIFTAGLVVRGGAIVASPEPIIDVYTWLRHAPGVLVQGENPYRADYPSPYGTERARGYGIPEPPDPHPPAYPPLPIVMALPCHLLGIDVRWSNVICDLLAAGVLLEAARRRGKLLIGGLLAGTYLHLPRVPFMIEQAWFEPMLAALLGSGLLLCERGRKIGYVFLALGLTGKQFGIALLPPVWRARRQESRWLIAALSLVGFALFLPFLLWDAESYVAVIFLRHLGRPPQYASLTVASVVYHLTELSSSRWLLWSIAGVLIVAIAWRTPATGCSAGISIAAALLVFCLFHTQGYFNYFYLCLYLLLLGVAGAEPLPWPFLSDPQMV